jgi:DNA-binding LacI/PurR family transcriptional regulator
VTTIKDVASLAGVGIGTVSRVLNDHPAVTASTRAKVRAAIELLDYEPHRAARALSGRSSRAIAVVVPLITQPSAVERLRGVLAALDESGYEVVLFSIDDAEQRRVRLGRLLRRDLADGLLLVSLRPTPEEVRRLREAGLPTVVVDGDVDGFPTFVVDDIRGGRLAARHLLELGHSRIAYVGDVVTPYAASSSSSRRLRGLAEELAAAGTPLDTTLVAEGRHALAVARRMALDVLQRSNPPPTAVFAHSDTQALGVLEAADELGLRVPEDLSVIGFDDIESARYAGLTTVRQPLFESGRLGGERILERLRGDQVAPGRVELPLEVVVRRTTAPCPAAPSTPPRLRYAASGRRSA